LLVENEHDKKITLNKQKTLSKNESQVNSNYKLEAGAHENLREWTRDKG